MRTFPPVIATVPRWLPLEERSLFVVLMPSPVRAIRISVPDSTVTLSLPFSALSSHSTCKNRFLTFRSSLV